MGVNYVSIEETEDVGQRLDNFLLRKLKGVPRQHIYRILRKGQVRVNGGRIKAGYRLKLNDRIRIPPVRTAQEQPLQYSSQVEDKLRDAVIYEDEHFLVLNKPVGLAVHAGSGIKAGIIEIMREMTANPRLELIHRLDRDTSGCLALAKNRRTLQQAQAQFRERTVKKNYELFVAGFWPVSVRTVQLKLQRYETSWGERRVRVSSQGQSARTDFAVLEHAGNLATRLKATLHTGRTHQIRVHASANGHPILGDLKYGVQSAERQRAERHLPAVPRLCLHAEKLTIPMEDYQLKVSAPVGEDLQRVWRAIKRIVTG